MAWFTSAESAWFLTALVTWLAQLDPEWLGNFIGAIWDATLYNWDDQVLVWDAIGNEGWKTDNDPTWYSPA